MGILGGFFDGVGDLFFGGDEKDAAKEARLGAERATDAYERAVERIIGYQTDALGQSLAIQDPYLQGGGYANQAALRVMGLPLYDVQDRTFSPRVGEFPDPPGVNPGFAVGAPTPGAAQAQAPVLIPRLFDARTRAPVYFDPTRNAFTDEGGVVIADAREGRIPNLVNDKDNYVEVRNGVVTGVGNSGVNKLTDLSQYQAPQGVLGGQTFLGGSATNPAGRVLAGGPGGFIDSGERFNLDGSRVPGGPVSGAGDVNGRVLTGGDRPSFSTGLQPGGVLQKLESVQDPDPYGGFTESPGYQFAFDQGMQALERAASASGLLGSGRYLKDATRFATGLANQEFGNYFNRLQALSGGSQAVLAGNSTLGAAGAIGSAINSGAGRVGDGLMTAADARASGILGANQARTTRGADLIGNVLGGML